MVRVWEVESGECLRVIKGRFNVYAVLDVEESQDARFVPVSKEIETIIHRARLDADAVVARLPQIFRRLVVSPTDPQILMGEVDNDLLFFTVEE